MPRQFLPLVAAALVCWLCASSGGSAEETGQDFRGKPYDRGLFRPTGPGANTAIGFDSQGLRIVLPPEHGRKPAVGIVLNTGLKGDFEITMEFEVVEVQQPQGGNGGGPTIWITMVSPTNEAATTGWQRKPSGNSVFFSHRASTPIGGSREHHGGTSPTECRSGKLRLVRTGETLTYLVAEGESDSFREIDTFELGKDDVDTVRFAADNGGSPTLVDVRIKGVKIKANALSAATPLPPPSSRWPLWLGTGAMLAAAGAYWFWRR
jgi:hypothetical protein